jgi:hypothetical protein
VIHHTNSDFWKLYDALPPELQALADKNYQLLRSDPKHPSLHFKKVGPYWSARVGRTCRAVPWRARSMTGWYGFGLARTPNMKD